ncbi:MAG: hypothetical protein K2X86_02945 [Cytophagaceae bacterium]|nr:hypothetical protein [Cytophagaceae bacterium]
MKTTCFLFLYIKLVNIKKIFLCSFFLFLIVFGCKKDREPYSKFDLENPTTNYECFNCYDVASNGSILKFSTVKISFDVKGKDKHLSKISSDAYIKISWNFPGANSGDYIIDRNDFTFDNNRISFNTYWYFSYSESVNLSVILYTGRGMKSDPLNLTITKVPGAN